MTTTMRKLADLPNQLGFQFTGMHHDGTERPCIVSRDDDGWHRVYDQQGVRIDSLAGWRAAENLSKS